MQSLDHIDDDWKPVTRKYLKVLSVGLHSENSSVGTYLTASRVMDHKCYFPSNSFMLMWPVCVCALHACVIWALGACVCVCVCVFLTLLRTPP